MQKGVAVQLRPNNRYRNVYDPSMENDSSQIVEYENKCKLIPKGVVVLFLS